MPQRPPFIAHWKDIQDADDSHYPGSEELHAIGSPFGRFFGLTRLGIHHEVLPPGRRTSYPHAEKTEEEFVYVIEGRVDAWIDGEVYALGPGDAVGFPAGTGISHTFINDSDQPARLLVVGERTRPDNQIYYPLNPERKAEVGEEWWEEVPRRPLGPHDGLPAALREARR
jgi:uncharacterized cupin superfamily protein